MLSNIASVLKGLLGDTGSAAGTTSSRGGSGGGLFGNMLSRAVNRDSNNGELPRVAPNAAKDSEHSSAATDSASKQADAEVSADTSSTKPIAANETIDGDQSNDPILDVTDNEAGHGDDTENEDEALLSPDAELASAMLPQPGIPNGPAESHRSRKGASGNESDTSSTTLLQNDAVLTSPDDSETWQEVPLRPTDATATRERDGSPAMTNERTGGAPSKNVPPVVPGSAVDGSVLDTTLGTGTGSDSDSDSDIPVSHQSEARSDSPNRIRIVDAEAADSGSQTNRRSSKAQQTTSLFRGTDKDAATETRTTLGQPVASAKSSGSQASVTDDTITFGTGTAGAPTPEGTDSATRNTRQTNSGPVPPSGTSTEVVNDRRDHTQPHERTQHVVRSSTGSPTSGQAQTNTSVAHEIRENDSARVTSVEGKSVDVGRIIAVDNGTERSAPLSPTGVSELNAVSTNNFLRRKGAFTAPSPTGGPAVTADTEQLQTRATTDSVVSRQSTIDMPSTAASDAPQTSTGVGVVERFDGTSANIPSSFSRDTATESGATNETLAFGKADTTAIKQDGIENNGVSSSQLADLGADDKQVSTANANELPQETSARASEPDEVHNDKVSLQSNGRGTGEARNTSQSTQPAVAPSNDQRPTTPVDDTELATSSSERQVSNPEIVAQQPGPAPAADATAATIVGGTASGLVSKELSNRSGDNSNADDSNESSAAAEVAIADDTEASAIDQSSSAVESETVSTTHLSEEAALSTSDYSTLLDDITGTIDELLSIHSDSSSDSGRIVHSRTGSSSAETRPGHWQHAASLLRHRPFGGAHTTFDNQGDVWRSIQMKLDEGDGHVTIRTRKEHGVTRLAIEFSDPTVRAAVEVQADRLKESLESRFDTAIDLSFGTPGGGQGEADRRAQPTQRRSNSSAKTTAREIEISSRPAKARVVPGSSNTWVG